MDVQRAPLLDYGYTFSPLDVPRDQFIVAGRAWESCRSGQADPDCFRIMDMSGWWFIWGDVIRLCLLVVLFLWSLIPFPQEARSAGTGYEVIDSVNQVRAANGLAPLNVNGALMAAAQGHSEYMAETGSVSHTGAGGSSPASRAAAAGYAGSGVIENIMSGANLTPHQAVQWWQGDSLHLSTLLSTSSEHAGAGVAASGDTVYITLVVGHTGSGSGSGSSSEPQPLSSAEPEQPAPLVTPEVVIQVEVSTPAADGSVIHVVEQGQTLWEIATAYKIGLYDLYALNGMDESSVIFPGERVLIKAASETPVGSISPTGTDVTASGTTANESTATERSTPEPSPTHKPATQTPAPQTPAVSAGTPFSAGQTGSLLPTPASAGVLQVRGLMNVDPILVVIALIALGGIGLILAGSLLKRGN
jgi:LysM repeat protein